MKKLSILLLSIGLAIGASAQGHPHVRGGGVRYLRPHVTIIGGIAPIYPYYGYGYGFGYNPFYAQPPFYQSYRPSELDLKIEEIRNDYQDRIWSVRHDKELSRKERRARVHEIKHERDKAIIAAKKSYYHNDNNA